MPKAPNRGQPLVPNSTKIWAQIPEPITFVRDVEISTSYPLWKGPFVFYTSYVWGFSRLGPEVGHFP